MKKILFLFGLLVSHITSFAFNTSTNFGFNQQKTEEEYQQYVGKCFMVRPAYGQLETWDKSDLNLTNLTLARLTLYQKSQLKI